MALLHHPDRFGRLDQLPLRGHQLLPDGQITAQGLVTYGPGEEEFRQKPYFFAITGGTGKYRAARGEIKIQELSAEEVRLTFRVIL